MWESSVDHIHTHTLMLGDARVLCWPNAHIDVFLPGDARVLPGAEGASWGWLLYPWHVCGRCPVGLHTSLAGRLQAQGALHRHACHLAYPGFQPPGARTGHLRLPCVQDPDQSRWVWCLSGVSVRKNIHLHQRTYAVLDWRVGRVEGRGGNQLNERVVITRLWWLGSTSWIKSTTITSSSNTMGCDCAEAWIAFDGCCLACKKHKLMKSTKATSSSSSVAPGH